jgi:hypothetical protein
MEFGRLASPWGNSDPLGSLLEGKMRGFVGIAVLLAAGWMVGDHPVSAQPNSADPCPLKWRKDPVAAAEARAAKKQRMRDNGVPERYLHLLDRMECVACIETAPDTLHITVLYNDDEHAPTLSDGRRDLKVEFKWNPQSERQLREELRSGRIRAFYVWIHEKRCTCCPDFDKKAESFADWDDDVGANMDETEQYDDPDDLGPLPDDLKPPPPGTQTPPPPIERFDDVPRPSRRVLQATCKPCEGLAEQWTKENSNLNFLWDRKIEQMRRVSVIANARANRQNEIENLEYQQRFDSTRTYDTGQKIRELKKVNEDQEADQDRAEQEIERLDGEIAATEMRMEALMQQFLACEKSCQKTTTADPTGNASTTANELPPAYYAGLPGPTTATLTPSLRLDPVIPGPPSTPATPDLAINTTGSLISPRLPDTSTATVLPMTARDYIATGTNSTLGGANTTGTGNVVGDPAIKTCLACQDAANAVTTAQGALRAIQDTLKNIKDNQALLERAKAGSANDAQRLQSIEGQLQQLAQAAAKAGAQEGVAKTTLADSQAQLAACQPKCTEKTAGPTSDLNTTGGNPTGNTTCSGAECAEEWNACTASNSCTPIDRDCGVPGTCSSSSSDAPNVNLSDPSNWSSSGNADVEQRIQIKFGDVFYDVVIRPAAPAKVGTWFNPLGLLARRLIDNVERWRGSAGPRPLINPRDLMAVEKYSSGQSIGLPKGVHVLLTDRGGSTGKTLAMQVLNLTGQPVRLASMPFAIEPITQQAQQRVQQAFNRLAKAAPVNLDLAGYCVEFLKLPPAANQIFRLAPASVQKKYEAMSKVLRSAYRVQHAGLFKPDSNPAAYTDSIKQWAIWAVEQKFNEKNFTEAFLGHTKKNVEAAGQQWSRPAEDMVRKVSPNRWRDILRVLQGAGLPVPQ